MVNPDSKKYTITEEQFRKLRLIDNLAEDELEHLSAVVKEMSR